MTILPTVILRVQAKFGGDDSDKRATDNRIAVKAKIFMLVQVFKRPPTNGTFYSVLNNLIFKERRFERKTHTSFFGPFGTGAFNCFAQGARDAEFVQGRGHRCALGL
jgi:hypothetical protein